MTHLVPIGNQPRDYAWGIPGGISHLLGGEATERPEAELWLGAHPLSPSQVKTDAPFADLADWERRSGDRLPFLLKILAASSALSLQAHPTPADAAAGFAREEAAGVPRDAPHRNYRDPFAKPELIVALEDGFEALCGFRVAESAATDLDALAGLAADPRPYRWWSSLLRGPEGIRSAFEWLMGRDSLVERLVAGFVDDASQLPERFAHLLRLANQYPDDPGVLVALMLNHVTLRAGECLWLPAGNIHAYLRGVGVELMGPSDNVLRGGLTPKHVDVPELLRVLDFSGGPAPYLRPEDAGPRDRVYRPASTTSGADVPFRLHAITGNAAIQTASPAIAIATAGAFDLRVGSEQSRVERGDAVFVTGPAALDVEGEGELFLADAAAVGS
ncbi:mannose-6-phosphate isomerase, class I [Microbacterium sp. CIAB417]|uniref:mannose-6-phosphate isomerase, class I n=1 Tax=Microbacterium sp. CIAB417 TaxID=2860287 RepID=UPI001FABBD9E|nr:mannose-6-phosphate isomerase, class I [Microbacterium sp. CIAB417]